MPDNVITQTWLAYAFERPVAVERVRAALARVGAHYGAQLAEPPPLRASLGDTDGLALWRHDDGSRWPAWAEGEGIAVAATAAPAGWRRVVGEVGAAEAALPLGRALAERPQRLAELVPPFVIGIREASAGPGAASGRLTIVNDFAGAGRIYERRLEPTDGALGAEGWVWSNRLGALPIFAGAEPEPDERGWSLFAAAGWFVADATPIRGTTRLAPGTAIGVRAGAGGAGAHVHHHVTRAAGELAGRHEAYFRGAVDEAANQAIGLARDLAELFAEPPTVDLSGGPDSRVCAAAAVAAGIDCRFATGDPQPGEPARPTLSGDGGEIARGVYYPSPGVLSEIKKGGEEGLAERLEREARGEHSAAHRDAYRAYRAEVERALDEGRRHGLAGAGLLDYFYLVHRLADRSGLGARGGRYSACLTPAFVRAAFDLTPEQRLEGKLHHDLIARLAPAESEAPLAEPADPDPDPNVPECGLWGVLRDVHRARIWERPGDAEAVEEMIAEGKAWPELFRRRPVRKAWKDARAGKASEDWEAVFNRIAWREGFEEHLRELARAATTELSARPQPHGGA